MLSFYFFRYKPHETIFPSCKPETVIALLQVDIFELCLCPKCPDIFKQWCRYLNYVEFFGAEASIPWMGNWVYTEERKWASKENLYNLTHAKESIITYFTANESNT